MSSLLLQLRTDLSGFRKIFDQLGDRFSTWWPEQEAAARSKLLGSCTPDADTAAVLAPRWTVEGLSDGEVKPLAAGHHPACRQRCSLAAAAAAHLGAAGETLHVCMHTPQQGRAHTQAAT